MTRNMQDEQHSYALGSMAKSRSIQRISRTANAKRLETREGGVMDKCEEVSARKKTDIHSLHRCQCACGWGAINIDSCGSVLLQIVEEMDTAKRADVLHGT